MAIRSYSTSIGINRLKSNSKYYLLNQKDCLFSNIFFARYQNSNCKEVSDILIDEFNKYVYDDYPVVIKCIKFDKLNESDFDLYINEINLIRNLKHQNILPLLACFVHFDELWLVSPVADYGSCYQLSRPNGLPESCIVLVLRDVLHALEYLHSKGIILRGLRTSRILVDRSGRCLITGMKHAISCIKDGKWMNTLHDYPSTAKYNLNWLSPELLEQNLCGYNYKSDIYSLGITCCELANGAVPFEELQPTELLLDKITGNYPRLLDQTCEEIKNLTITDCGSPDLKRFEIYRNRRFSDYFHDFTINNCLRTDANKRPSATQLLNHKLIKKIRKSSNLIDLLPKKVSITDNFLKSCQTIEPYLNDFCPDECGSCEHCKYGGFYDSHFIKNPIYLYNSMEKSVNWLF